MENQTMNLEDLMLQEGQFMTVANVKKGSIQDKIRTTKEPLRIKVLAEKVEEIKWDLRYKMVKEEGKFEFSPEFFKSIPSLENAGVGFSEFYIPSLNKTVLILCQEDVENKFKVVPKILNTKKGDNKSLLFKAMSFEFYMEKSQLITKNPENPILFTLTEEMEGVYGITPAQVVVEVKADDMVVDNSTEDNSPLINTTETVVNLSQEDVLNLGQLNDVIAENSNIPFTAENVTTEQEISINDFESAAGYNPAYLADQLDEFVAAQ